MLAYKLESLSEINCFAWSNIYLVDRWMVDVFFKQAKLNTYIKMQYFIYIFHICVLDWLNVTVIERIYFIFIDTHIYNCSMYV